jgi:hypothetical protein
MTSRGSTLQVASDADMSEMMLNSPIRIGDATAMLRKRINANEKPYTAEVLRQNNARVDEWQNSVLRKIARDDGCIPAGRVEGCLRYFIEGKEIYAIKKFKDMNGAHLPQISDETVKFWIDYIKRSSPTELYQVGAFVLTQGWGIIQNAITLHFSHRKWEEVYSQSDDPATWDKLANDHPHTMNNKQIPFGLDSDTLNDMRDKVMAVLRTPIEPQ